MPPGLNKHHTWSARGERSALGTADPYITRAMLGLVLSLVLILGLLHLPVYQPVLRTGWLAMPAPPPEYLTLEQLGLEQLAHAQDVPVVVVEDGEGDGDGGDEAGADEALAADLQPETRAERAPARIEATRAQLEFAEVMPKVVGGLGAYYINIDYPEAARRSGIEGRLMLNFLVDAEGWASEIEVTQPLHPLLDSAAVRALRDTRFVPGTQEGKAVAVRMTLPVRFRLVERPELPDNRIRSSAENDSRPTR
jgi:periplasmic protein TonB